MQYLSRREYEELQNAQALISALADALEAKQWNVVTGSDLELICKARQVKLVWGWSNCMLDDLNK
jgi:hypothetical protein